MGLLWVGGWLSRSRLERDVAGEYNTFRVYLLMLRVKEASGRDVAHQLGFSSPALAVHHLEKLSSLELVKKDKYCVYHVIPQKFGMLSSSRFPRQRLHGQLYHILIDTKH